MFSSCKTLSLFLFRNQIIYIVISKTRVSRNQFFSRKGMFRDRKKTNKKFSNHLGCHLYNSTIALMSWCIIIWMHIMNTKELN